MKLWAGRFVKATDKLTEEMNASIQVDGRMYKQDVAGSIAHVNMLARQGIVSEDERDQIVQALNEIAASIESGQLQFTIAAEDVHMNIETFLIQKIGDVGKKLHTARSRNDQVALDVRLYLRDESRVIRGLILELEALLLDLAEKHTETVMPGFTHMQKAQPVSLAHHLMAYFEMLRRDLGRLDDLNARLDSMPLGSGALAGTGFDLDREYVREQLGFGRLTRNSLDAVSDRDFAIEFCSFASILMMHLSRFCEELIIWSSEEYSYVEMDDRYSTGSSIMPQKKNPDLAELIRGKTGRVYGSLTALLTIMKALPLAYNKDMQEDKEALFDAIDTIKQCLTVFAPMLETASFNPARMAEAAAGGFTNATDLADYLAARGMPFREAHEVVGRAVLYALSENKSLEEISLDKYQSYSVLIKDDIFDYIKVYNCMARRKLPGGTAPQAVKSAVLEARQWLNESLKEGCEDMEFDI